MQTVNTCSSGSDRRDNRIPYPRLVCMQTQVTGASGSISLGKNILLLFNAVSWMAADKGGFVCETGSII